MRDRFFGRARRAAVRLALVAISTGSIALACSSENERSSREAIRSVLARDGQLGEVRNHASETESLDTAVRDYVRGLEVLDFGGCPPDFTAAFERHREAWKNSIGYFEQHGHLRGEMHDLFEEIRGRGGAVRAELEAIEGEIWGTWAEVETSVERHGASAPR